MPLTGSLGLEATDNSLREAIVFVEGQHGFRLTCRHILWVKCLIICAAARVLARFLTRSSLPWPGPRRSLATPRLHCTHPDGAANCVGFHPQMPRGRLTPSHPCVTDATRACHGSPYALKRPARTYLFLSATTTALPQLGRTSATAFSVFIFT